MSEQAGAPDRERIYGGVVTGAGVQITHTNPSTRPRRLLGH